MRNEPLTVGTMDPRNLSREGKKSIKDYASSKLGNPLVK